MRNLKFLLKKIKRNRSEKENSQRWKEKEELRSINISNGYTITTTTTTMTNKYYLFKKMFGSLCILPCLDIKKKKKKNTTG